MSDVAVTKVTTNLFGERWSKLTVNCMANPIAGLSGLGTAEVRTLPEPRLIAIYAGGEAVKVGRACGFEVEPIYGIVAQRFVDAYEGRGLAEVEADVAAEGARRGGGRPSLLQDVMRGRRTEIDYLNGYVCEQGRHRGVKTPVNDAIVETVRSYGVGQLKPDPKNLAPILKVLPKR